jgi:type I restriction enzyme R subunit
MNESETRRELIDPLLTAAGWGVVPDSKVHSEHPITDGRIMGMGRRGKREVADYVLAYRGRKLAVLEAKSDEKGVTEGLAQAKQYAEMLSLRFAYASNGKGLYRVDMSTGAEGDVDLRFPSPQELWDMVFETPNAQRDDFASVPWADKGTGWKLRYYQEKAANAVLDAIAGGRSRLLLTLATGTGKTSIAAQIAWKLHQARWSLSKEIKRQPRILFLADRNGLASQAYSDFSSFNVFEERALVRITAKAMSKDGNPPMNGAVFFTIFQTFMTGESEDNPGTFAFGAYPKDYFDLVIIDECHRGGANDQGTWRGILEHFSPAVQLGLTATPKRTENADTYAYFGEPLVIYSLKQGINDGFLTPFKVLQVATSVDDVTIDAGDVVVQGQPEAGKVYGHKDFNRSIVSPERDAFMVRKFMELVNTDQKTLVFCRDQDHAARVRDLISQAKRSPHPNYCVRVTANDGEIGEMHLRDFQQNDKSLPTVLTTSQKLSTGVDARNVRNIVLMRPVGSMIEFKQIIGRGTRLFEGKEFFTIVDFVNAHHHFSDPEWDGDPVAPEPKGPNEPKAKYGDKPQGEDGAGEGPEAPKRPERIVVHLGPNKTREIKSYVVTRFYNADGQVVTAAEFLKDLFGVLPDFFHDEEELRRIWSQPETRRQLLERLSEKGFPLEQLHEMQKVIDAENCDLFDVLAYVAFESNRVPRSERSRWARRAISSDYGVRQRAFLEFVLEQYERVGVEELDQDKLPELLKLRYQGSIADALNDLGGDPDKLGEIFAGFQRHLYEEGMRS